jgi:glutaredoxin
MRQLTTGPFCLARSFDRASAAYAAKRVASFDTPARTLDSVPDTESPELERDARAVEGRVLAASLPKTALGESGYGPSTLAANEGFADVGMGAGGKRIRRGEPMASDIQVYGTDWCGVTYGVRRYLTAGRFEYDYFNIDDDDNAEEFVLATSHGLRRFPIVVIEDRVVTRPTVAELRRVLDQHGMRPRHAPASTTQHGGRP